jgi:hypothetical protein
MPVFSRVLFRRVSCLLPALALFVLAASCNGFFVSNSTVTSVAITPTAVLLKAGLATADSNSSNPLSVTANTAGNGPVSNPTVTWTSSDPSVVAVAASSTGTGVLTAGTSTTANATATVTAKDGSVTSNVCTVVLYTGTAPTSLNVASQNGATTFAAGTTFQAIASGTFTGDTSLSVAGALTPYVTWSTSDDTGTIVTISTTGIVTVVGTSSFTVTATATFGDADTSTNPLSGTSLVFNNTTL